jgi:hypothetical protein
MIKRALVLFLFFCFSIFAIAEIPRTISYQGILTDTETSEPLIGSVTLTVRLYTQAFCDDTDTENAIWEETHENVQLSNGVFNIVLGSINDLDEQTVSFDQPYCIGITIGDGTELPDRIPLTSSPYSLNPGEFPVPLHLRASVASQAIIEGNNISAAANSIGVQGIHETSGNYGILGHDDYGVYGYLNNDHFGLGAVYGKADNGNIGYLADQWYGVYSYHDDSENEAYLTSDEFAFWGKNPSGFTEFYASGDNIAGEGKQFSNTDLLMRLGRIATDEYGVYGEQFTVFPTMGYLAGSLAGAYGQSKYTHKTNYGCLACTGDLISRIGPDAIRSCGVFGYEADKDNWGYIAYKDAGVFGCHQNTQNKGWLGDSYAGVHGINENTGNYGYLASADAGAKGIGNDYGIVGFSSTGTGAYGKNETSGNFGYLGDDNYGVYGENGDNGNIGILADHSWGVFGEHGTSNNYGYLGDALYGVYGFYDENDNYGYLGSLENGAYGHYEPKDNYGILGCSDYGVFGFYDGAATDYVMYGNYGYLGSVNYGAYGKNEIHDNFGYLGGSSYGAYGEHASGNKGALGLIDKGVYGEATGGGFAIRGYNPNGTAVFGYIAGFSMGVYGKVISSNSNWGYLGGTTYAGSFGGNVYIGGNCNVSGVLTKGGGSFKIDHPLDPENKFLSHSFVESPDMMNVYNGNVVLDEKGEAWIELPEYFDVINRDFRYQLTCIGGFAQVYIAEEIHDNKFKVSGGKDGLKVSWQVTGIRKDPFAEKHRIIVEEEKAECEKGFYLHPDLYSQPETKQLEWGRDPELMRAIIEDNGK